MPKIRQAAVQAAHDFWKSVIRDPEDADAIEQMFIRTGWGAWMRRETNGDGYDGEQGVDWCGHAVSSCYLLVGDYLYDDRCVGVTLDHNLAYHVFASTYRLQSPEKWRKAGYNEVPSIKPEQIGPGDVATVNPTTSKPYGSHIVMAISSPKDGKYKTMEGNAHGNRGDGTYGKGFIKRERELSNTAKAFEVLPHMMKGEL